MSWNAVAGRIEDPNMQDTPDTDLKLYNSVLLPELKNYIHERGLEHRLEQRHTAGKL